jgi:hypothetical protein
MAYGKIKISFTSIAGQIKVVPGSRIGGDPYSPEMSIPEKVFRNMVRQAAQIFKEKKQYQWFVKPLDAATNEVIYNGLRALGSSDADEMRKIIDENGVSHLAWETDYSFVSHLEKSAKQKALKFQVFNRTGENAKARPWPFPRRRPPTAKKKPASKKTSM